METKDKIYGTIFGQAIGDALGLGTEFLSKTEVRRSILMDWKNTAKSSETTIEQSSSQAVGVTIRIWCCCIANAIIEDKGINLHTIARNFKQWGYAPETRGVGQTTLKVLSIAEYVEKPHQVAELIWRMTRTKNAANGSVMRTAIIGLKKENVAQTAEDVCKPTHFDPRCVGSCVIVSEIINHLIWHDEQLSYSQIMTIGNKYDKSIAEYIDKAYYNGIESLELDEPSSIGYTLKALGSALWCLFHANDFEEGLLRVVNEGGDADTNAAVACAMLGAKFGYTSIPQKYTDGLTRKSDLMRITNYLMQIDI